MISVEHCTFCLTIPYYCSCDTSHYIEHWTKWSHFANYIFKCFFRAIISFALWQNVLTKLVPEAPLEGKSLLVQVMYWHRTGDKQLPEPMMAISYMGYEDIPWLHMDHYTDVIMATKASQITSFMIVYSIEYLDADQRKHQTSTSLAFVRGIHRDRWIPRTNGQQRGKCFHLMTSSWWGSLSYTQCYFC